MFSFLTKPEKYHTYHHVALCQFDAVNKAQAYGNIRSQHLWSPFKDYYREMAQSTLRVASVKDASIRKWAP